MAAVRRAIVILAALVLAVAPAAPAFAASWTLTPTPHPAPAYASRLTGVDAVSAGTAWAVGYAEYTSAPTARPIVARWSGGAWTSAPTPALAADARLEGVDAGPGGDGLWAVGSAGSGTLTQRWTGTAWTVVPSPSPAGASAASLDDVKTLGAGTAWAVGRSAVPADHPGVQTLIERWNGTSWSILPSPSPDPGQNLLSGVDGVAANDLWAVGGMGLDGYGNQPVAGLILHWNGSAWTQSPIPSHPTLRVSDLRDVVAIAANDVWAVGVGFSWQRFSQVPVALHWNGQAWQHVAVPGGDAFFAVTALSPTRVYAAGSGPGGAYVAQWNGTAWVTQSTPATGPLAAAAAAAPGSVWAVGLQFGSGGMRTLGIYTGNG